jgi:hypothetical protein
MTVFELMERLTGIGASLSADGGQVAVRFPEEHRRDVERLGLEIQRLKPELLRELARKSRRPRRANNSPEDIDLALKICSYMETLPADRSATISELAEALHGRRYTMDHVTDIYLVCEELREARILIRGRDGYGYQLSCPRGQAPRT